MSEPDTLADRYGAPVAGGGGARSIVGSGVLGVVVPGLAGLDGAGSTATPTVSSDIVTFDDRRRARRDRARSTYACDATTSRRPAVLRAFAEDHTVVGELSFAVDAPRSTADQRRADDPHRAPGHHASSCVGCTTPDQQRPR